MSHNTINKSKAGVFPFVNINLSYIGAIVFIELKMLKKDGSLSFFQCTEAISKFISAKAALILSTNCKILKFNSQFFQLLLQWFTSSSFY